MDNDWNIFLQNNPLAFKTIILVRLLVTLTRVSHRNHIKMDNLRSYFEIPNEIIGIMKKKKRLKLFSHVLHKNNASYVNH